MTELLLVISCLTQTPPQFAAPIPDAIPWQRDFAAARREANEHGKPMFVVVAFPTCKWWLRMERTTMKDERVRKLIAKTIPVQINGEVDETLNRDLNVIECPVIVVLSSSGKIVLRTSGFREVEPFLKLLESALGK